MNSEGKKTGAVLVVGGGIGGIQASLDLAESGFLVYLVESSPAIGGTMAQLDKTFPTNDCSMCILSPKLVECGRHLNIELITYAELKEVSGEAGDFRVKILKKPRYVDLEKCTGCAECEGACPIEIASEFDEGLSTRHAIYRSYPQAIPNVYTIEKTGVSPCRNGCPAGVKVQGYVALTSKRKFKEALDVVREALPFPAICGRACYHPCEEECNRKDVDEPVSTRLLHRFIADWARENGEEAPQAILSTRAEKIAIIGAGPSGLTCALRLLERGYPVTIFEASDKAGGMISSCIPDYRSPTEIADYEIDRLLAYGMELRTNVKVGRDITLEQLRKEYKAVYIAIGAQDSAGLPVEGVDARGVLYGLSFLRDVKAGRKVEDLGQRVIVIGGGNTAIDSARTALRLGAREVTIVYRRSRDEMTASDEEIEQAEEEGVKIHFLVAPVSISSRNGKVDSMECMRMVLGEPDDSGRRRPEPIAGSEFSMEVDTVIAAIGQVPDFTGFQDVEQTPRGTIKADEVTLETNLLGVFSGGDIVTGPASIIEAVAHGNEAAESIDRFLNGVDLREGRQKEAEVAPLPEGKIERKERVEILKRAPRERGQDFNEIELGFSEEAAVAEASRCLNCAVCSECLQCVAACEAEAIDYRQREEIIELNVGSIILAPGFDEFDARLKPEYGYEKFPNVVTSIQFERMLSASGPFQGHLQRSSDGEKPKSIAFIQCVGSRDLSCGRPYCSSVCCTYAIKEAIIAREHAEDVRCTIFYMDMRTYGKDFDKYLERAQADYGVRLIRCRVSEVQQNSETKNLVIKYESEGGGLYTEEFDLVVLSVGLDPPKQATELAGKLGIELNEYNFAKTSEFKPVETSRAGIFVCGAFSGPKDIPETVTQASGAAAGAEALLSPARGSLVREKEFPPEIDITGQEPRIGAFICHCGINIGGYVDVPKVVEYAKTLPGVVYVEDNLYTCSQDTQQQIKAMITEHNLNRVVVASCTPRTHEPLFQETIREAGLNRYLFEMANIRDQCSWVHMYEKEAATQKAQDLVRMAVAKARLLKPLTELTVGVVNKGLVIGGGMAGMTAALELANQGFECFLVERKGELGGNLRRVYHTLEGGDVQELLENTIQRISENELIHIFTNAELKEINGFVGNFKTTLRSNGQEYTLEHGTIILACGGEEYKPTEYLYGKHDRVVTQLELEQQLAARSLEAKDLNSVVMIQCVGSRDDERPYCSRICCSQAIKNALKIKEENPGANIYILYRDVRAYGFKEEFYHQAMSKGVIFIRYDQGREPQVNSKNGKLEVEVLDPILMERLVIDADLLVLSAGVVPSASREELSKMLKVPLNQDGFFLEAHVKLRPIEFATDGIFLCGLAHSPKPISENISQAQAAAAKAAIVLSKEFIISGGYVAEIDKEKCTGCGLCIQACYFDAISYNEELGVCELNPVLCKGCGNCAVICPSGACQVEGFRDEQILPQVRAYI